MLENPTKRIEEEKILQRLRNMRSDWQTKKLAEGDMDAIEEDEKKVKKFCDDLRELFPDRYSKMKLVHILNNGGYDPSVHDEFDIPDYVSEEESVRAFIEKHYS
jgi:hypothetical protein